MKNFTHTDALTVREAAEAKAQGARIIAGGSDLLGELKDKILPEYPEQIVNIKTIPGLDAIEETEDGYLFQYDSRYLQSANPAAASLTLPLREAPYQAKILFPFFDGLIPEGWLLDVVSSNWKIDRNDRFGLLLIACKDAVGAVHVQEERS